MNFDYEGRKYDDIKKKWFLCVQVTTDFLYIFKGPDQNKTC